MSTDVVTIPLGELPGILRECLRSGLLAHRFDVAHRLGPDAVRTQPRATLDELDAFLRTVANNAAQILVGMSAAEE